MTPEQEFEKIKAAELASKNFYLDRCFECNGIAYCVDRYGAVHKCSRCGGTGKIIRAHD
jgi:hypothetical protein